MTLIFLLMRNLCQSVKLLVKLYLVTFVICFYFTCCCFNFMYSILDAGFYLIFYFLIRSGDIHQNPGPRNGLRALYINIRGLKANFQDICVASGSYDLMFCSETLVSNFRHSSEIHIPNFRKPVMLRRDSIPRARGMCVYIRSSCVATRQSKFECRCHEILLVKIYSRFNNYYFFQCIVIRT